MASRRSPGSVAVLAVALLAALTLTGCTSGAASAPRSSSPAPRAVPSPFATFGAMPTAALDATKAAALQHALEGELAQGYPDALATVITPDGVWSGAAGVDGPKGRKARPGDVLAVASVTKTFTAALILRLVEQKKIDLDAPLARYLVGAAAGKTNGATVQQALEMRAGIPDTPDDVVAALAADPTKHWTQDEVVAAFPAADAKPGVQAASSNPTYKMLAFAAEHVTGSTWADLVRTDLVGPAHVPGVLVAQTADARTPGTWGVPPPKGDWGAGGTLPFVADSSFARGSSDMAADTRSLATWAWALFAGRIVSPTSLTTMTVDPDGSGIATGLDPYSAPLPEGSLGHQGSKGGYAAFFVGIPSKQTVIAVELNDEDASVDVIASDLLAALG